MSTSATDPGELFGGTWQRIEGRFLLGADSGHTAGSTGGEEEHTLTVGEMPSHSHSFPVNSIPSGTMIYTIDGSAGTEVDTFSASSAGGNQPHNNMPPYVAVYIWKRIA